MVGDAPRVLHLCSDFAKQLIYPRLVRQLAECGVRQEVYAAVRTEAETLRIPVGVDDVNYHVRRVLIAAHRLCFRTKVRVVTRDLCSQVRLAGIGVTHAHFLYSDGAVALRLKQSYGIPYVVAVRNTDVNFFMRFRPDLRWIMHEVLRQASGVVLLTPAYRSAILEASPRPLRSTLEGKTHVIPNGIESEWLSARPLVKRTDAVLRLLYVGDFSRNKNIPGLLKAVQLLVASREVRLTLVGGGGDGEAEVERLLRSGSYAFAKHVGRIDDPDILRDEYRKHDLFVMPSFCETFGIVFLEALSQGLPIIHSRGQGVDGYFEATTVSESVDPKDPDDIAGKIHVLAARAATVRAACIAQAKRFDWSQIAESYSALYRSIAAVTMECRK